MVVFSICRVRYWCYIGSGVLVVNCVIWVVNLGWLMIRCCGVLVLVVSIVR